MATRFFVETYGCQMNFHDGERLAGLLVQAGYAPASSAAEADIVVINTCSVRERAEEKLFTRLGEIRAEATTAGRRPLVAVAGCVAQQEGAAILKRSPLVDVIVGTQAVKRLPALIEEARRANADPVVDVNPYEDVSFPLGVAQRSDPVRAWVTIIEGCNDFCAFCVVPYTRGRERMRPFADVIAEVEDAARMGRPEVQLLGQIVNHYQAPDDPACDFAELLRRVAAVDGISRVRFASPHPRHVSDRLIDVLESEPKVCRHLHLPVQSGSTRVLHAMRRRYSRAGYLALASRLRERVPGLHLSTDIIVGFPGETRDEFEETLSLVEQVQYHSIFSFKYSPRPNTLAVKRMSDDVPEEEKTRRIVALQGQQRDIQMRLHQQAIGSTVAVLVDSTSRRRPWEVSGRTSGNTVVNLPGGADLVGRTIRVTIERAGPNSLWGIPAEVASGALEA
jgi:tRNA-2-methylthio-N6-dimethylallyladenosine synthase